MSTWPATLPNMKLGTSVGDDESRLVTPMDTGPSTVRKRFTAYTRTLSVPMILDGTQLDTFLEFYRDTINQGTDAFDWTDPVDDTTVSMRFKSPPTFQSIKSGAVADRIWSATLNLEFLP